MEQHKLIELYIQGKLSEADKILFEQKIKNDDALANMVRMYRDIHETLNDKEVMEFHENLENIYQHLKSEEPGIFNDASHKTSGKKIWLRWYTVAAAAVVAAGLIISMFFFALRPNKNERLYAAFFKPYDAGNITRSVGQGNLDLYTIGLNAYDSADYERAVGLFIKVSDTDNFKMPANLLAGISAMQTGNADLAIEMFQKVNNASLCKEAADWYLALCYIRKNEFATAEKLLDKLIKGSGPYSESAKKLLEEMK